MLIHDPPARLVSAMLVLPCLKWGMIGRGSPMRTRYGKPRRVVRRIMHGHGAYAGQGMGVGEGLAV